METPIDRFGIAELIGDTIRTARKYRGLGFRPIPLLPGTKRAAVPWKAFQTRFPTDGEIEAMFARRCNIALGTGMGLVVIDVDDPAIVQDVISRCGDTPMKCRTPRGGLHLYFQMAPGIHYGGGIKIHGLPIDLRCEGHFITCPWSKSADGVPYQWLGPILPLRELPPLTSRWLIDVELKNVHVISSPSSCESEMVRRANAYIARIEGAISGEGGHNKTFRVCHVLAHKFGLTEELAWPLLLQWNETCQPPWSLAELRHKIRDVYRPSIRRGS